ncbi:MAG TPA: helicase HerA-like domain-containing protein, partial [Vicinamibacteria bacterium]|nr:helicase HerA-like domain-containing protein [Vicinamibacteria bacterium]
RGRLELDPTDLLTHGLIVGMTGSGKTGLAIDLIEETLRQGIPVLAIDPKGDLANLLLLFDRLEPAQFAAWVDPETARRQGQTPEQAGAEAAAQWTKGLASWGLTAADVADLRARHEAVIFTPGSRAGVPLGMLQSLEAPKGSFDTQEEDLRDEIAGIVAGLLGLVGIEADPLRSREAILLGTLIETAWRQGKGMSLETLIPAVADPPFERLGALPVETVYPRRERESLMLALNNLLASPSFEEWREGEPLDIDKMLRAADGRPRLSIVSTSHLSDAERLFVTALVLDKVKTWMRRQGGTTQLRALVYMDEIYGYFPPHPANPPTKRPLITLLKQARAQGVGIVLATQNPVDLDYKGLANIGVWLVGKLQTAQDRERLREGLTGAGMASATVDALLDATGKRVFLLHDVHRPAPVLVESRWAMSYLRGPLTREEIGRLMADRVRATPAVAAPASTKGAASSRAASAAPVVPSGLGQSFLNHFGGERADPYLLVKYAVRYKGMDESVGVRAWPLDAASAAELFDGDELAVDEAKLSEAPPDGIGYAELPAYLGDRDAVRSLEKAIKDRLPGELAGTVWTDPLTKATSQLGEDRAAFAARLGQSADAPAVARLRDRLDQKKGELEARQRDLEGRRTEKWVALGSAVLSNIGLFTGRKRTISGAGTVLSKNRMEGTAEARVEALKAEIADLEQELAAHSTVDPARLQSSSVVPTRTQVKLLRYGIVWVS